MKDFIKLVNVSKSYGDLDIFNNLNIDFEENKIYTIIGPSGSGKTTLMRCLSKIEDFNSGEVYISGEKQDEGKHEIGFVFQSFNLFDNLNVMQNLCIGPVMSKKVPESDAKDKAEKILEKVGLLDKLNEYPSKLSGGQKQRVAIARTLMMDPKIIIFDEPTSALDPESTRDVLKIIKEILDEKTTAIIITHEMKFAKEVSDIVIFMENGKVVEQDTPDELFNNTKEQRTKDFISGLGD